MSVTVGHRGFSLSYDNAEALKWLAFACMVVDHVNSIFFDRSLEWAGPVGRVAMPIFALLVARHLDNERVLQRLGLFGLVACVPHALALHGGVLLPLNILLTFWLAGVIVYMVERGHWLPALLAFVAGGLFVEYNWPGLVLVISAWAWWQGRTLATWMMLAVGLAMLCLLNGNAWALFAAPLALAASMFDWRVPRIRHFFWVGYPLHLAVLALLAFALGV